jgi:3-deoxy-D-manno-octulosonate 8-phosphate phosphatase (KDO 8-P phosphatase)
MSKARARKIKLLLFDVDGVMTDGKLWILPNPPLPKPGKGGAPAAKGAAPIGTPDEIEAKGFHAHDGSGISLAGLAGLKTGLITKRVSETVALRARDLKLDYVYQGVAVKVRTFEEILRQEKITATEAAYVGDDVIDLPVMRRCGFAVAVANARDEVKQEAHWVTPHAGGDGALRDVVDYILRAQGSWHRAVKAYLERGDAKPSS